MAECNFSRCSYERRLLRRELQKWNKEILFVIGLERLAEELMGTRKWKLFVEPFMDLENKNPDDWYPEDTCYICNSKVLPPYDPASGIVPVTNGYYSLRIDVDDHSTSSDQGTAPGSSPPCASALSPWYAAASVSTPGSVPSGSLDEPLDLSFRPISEELTNAEVSSSTNSLIKVPQIPLKPGQRKRVDGSSKKTYTDEELQAALRDIQSGKLGTRRAAVIYGIPRSTLRNKVYKLANESKSRAHCRVSHGAIKGKFPGKVLKQEGEINDATNCKQSASASESLRQLLKQTITQKTLSSTKSADIADNSIGNQNNGAEQLFQTLEYSKALAPVLSQVFANIHQLALGRYKEKLSKQSLSALKIDDLKLPILPDLIHRLAEERLEIEQDYLRNQESAHGPESDSLKPPSRVILKVPSFKASSLNDVHEAGLSVQSSCPNATSSQNFSGYKGLSASLKDLILSNITPGNNADKCIDELNINSYQSKCIDSTVWNMDEKLKQIPKDDVDLQSSESLKSEKRTRPKRGRYRNYDRDNLARAVRAVQKGEMSVHRAGTFYGVPHSTLEYKVKERHLLRPRKRELFTNSSAVDSSDSALDSSYEALSHHTKNDIPQLHTGTDGQKSETDDKCPMPMDFPSPFSLWQSMPFFSLDFPQLASSNFFASQMMRKLQENARLQEHEDNQRKGKTQELGILESLIKSTLDRPITPDDMKSLPFDSEACEVSHRGREKK